MKLIKSFTRRFLSVLLLAPLIANASAVPMKIENMSDAISYLGYNDKLIVTVPDIKENHTPYILPVQNENGYGKKIISFFDGNIPLKDIRKENNDFILQFENKDRCLDYYYNRVSDFRQVSIQACNNYVSQIIFTYSNKGEYRLSSEELKQRFDKIVNNIEDLGFTQKSKNYSIFNSIGSYFSISPQVIKLEKGDTDIIVQINGKYNNIFIAITQKDSHKKYLEIKDKISHNKAVGANKKIDDFIK